MVRYEVFVTSKTASFENECQTKKKSFLLFSFAGFTAHACLGLKHGV